MPTGRKTTMLRTLILLVMLAPAFSFGQSVYKTTDEHGNVIFTDAPPVGSSATEQVEIQPTNTTPPPPTINRPESAAEEENVTYSVAISSPANETTIAMGPGNFSVSASVKPGLVKGYQLQLFMDGAPHGEPQAGASWNLTNVFRGGHDLTVKLVDRDGKTIASSEAVRVYVLRPSINNPNRARPSPR